MKYIILIVFVFGIMGCDSVALKNRTRCIEYTGDKEIYRLLKIDRDYMTLENAKTGEVIRRVNHSSWTETPCP